LSAGTSVQVGVAGRLVGADRERLLQVRRSLGALGIAVRLDAGRQPAPAADRDGITLLDLRRQREERAGLGADLRAQLAGHAVPADQEESHGTKRGVDLGGDVGPGGVASVPPGREVDHGN
jgi:hypothetical protein